MADDTQIRNKMTALASALREFHSALLAFARQEYEFLHGPVKNPFELYSLVMNNPEFQWLRPLSGLMATLDEVLDTKGLQLTQRQLGDVQHALGLLFGQLDPQFADFRAGYTRAKNVPAVREAEAKWRSILGSVEA